MSQSVKRTFAVFVEDKPGVLNRVASLFRRRSFNIDSLNVGATHEAGAKRHGAEVLRLAPDFTITDYLASLHYTRPEDEAHHRQALISADLPE